jgi:L-lactate dehydrogenase (cytochrome)
MPAVEDEEPSEEDKKIEEERQKMPRADAMLLIDDFEYWAERVLSGTAWNYYKSAADREISESFLFFPFFNLFLYPPLNVRRELGANKQRLLKTWTHSNDIISAQES